MLETNQRLWGEPFGLNVDPTGPIPANPARRRHPGNPGDRQPEHVQQRRRWRRYHLGQRCRRPTGQRRRHRHGQQHRRHLRHRRSRRRRSVPISWFRATPPASRFTGAAAGNITVAADDQRQHWQRRQRRQPLQRHRHVQRPVTGAGRTPQLSASPPTPARRSAFTGAITLTGRRRGDARSSRRHRRRHRRAAGTDNAPPTQITGFAGTGIDLSGVASTSSDGVTLNTVSTGTCSRRSTAIL